MVEAPQVSSRDMFRNWLGLFLHFYYWVCWNCFAGMSNFVTIFMARTLVTLWQHQLTNVNYMDSKLETRLLIQCGPGEMTIGVLSPHPEVVETLLLGWNWWWFSAIFSEVLRSLDTTREHHVQMLCSGNGVFPSLVLSG